MITLQPEEMEKLGLTYVLDMLSPCSPYGREHVRRLRYYAPTERDALEQEWRNINTAMRAIDACEANVVRLQHVFMQLRDIRTTLQRLREHTCSEVELFEVKRFLLQLSLLVPIYREIDMPFEGIQFTEEMQALALMDPGGKHLPTYYVHAQTGSTLDEVRTQKNAMERHLRTVEPGIMRDELLAKRRTLVAREEQEAHKVRQELSQSLRPYVDALLENTQMIGKLDFILQKALLAKQWDCTLPRIVEDGLRFKGMVHPKIHDALKERGGFTSIDLEAPMGVAVITGANMGGKSVAIRTLTLQLLLCHAGFFVFAKNAELMLFDAMHIITENTENELGGLSSFGAEVLRLQKMFVDVQSNMHCFVALDEPARGTNPEEGAALVRAVASKLSKNRVVAVIATHYDGVADVAQVHYRAASFTNLPAVLPEGRGIFFISQHINYGLVRVDRCAKAPHDALTMCRLLGLDEEVLSEMGALLQ